MSEHNGHAEPAIPGVRVLYVVDPKTQARKIVGVEIGGRTFAGIIGVSCSASPQTGHVAHLELTTFWPCEWVEMQAAPAVIPATRMPPEPPFGPRRMD